MTNNRAQMALTTLNLAIICFLILFGQTLAQYQQRSLQEHLAQSSPVTCFLGSRDQGDSASVQRKIAALKGVTKAVLVTPDAACDEFARTLGGEAAVVLKGVPPRIFPSVIRVTLDYATVTQAGEFAKTLSAMKEIESVAYPEAYLAEAVPSVAQSSALIRYIMIVVMSGLLWCGILALLYAAQQPGIRSWYQLPLISLGGVAASFLLFLTAQRSLLEFNVQVGLSWQMYTVTAFGVALTAAICFQLVGSRWGNSVCRTQRRAQS